MNNKLDDYNKMVEFIGDIIKATDHQNATKDIDNTLDIAHLVGNIIKVVSDKK